MASEPTAQQVCGGVVRTAEIGYDLKQEQVERECHYAAEVPKALRFSSVAGATAVTHAAAWARP